MSNKIQNKRSKGLGGLRPIRLARAWSQQRMAQELDCSLPYVSQLELGKVSIRLDRAEEFAERLGVTLDELRNGPDAPGPGGQEAA